MFDSIFSFLLLAFVMLGAAIPTGMALHSTGMNVWLVALVIAPFVVLAIGSELYFLVCEVLTWRK